MAEQKDTLLYKIKRLYSELFLESLYNRLDSYRILHQSPHLGIDKTLHKLIDKIADEAKSTPTVQALHVDRPESITHMDVSNGKYSRITSHSTNIFTMTLNGLSLFLHKLKAHETDPRLANKLKQCVWDHVHTAHRYARSGDSETAKLHANIASSAIKTLSHYLPEAEYEAFYNEIDSELNLVAAERTEFH